MNILLIIVLYIIHIFICRYLTIVRQKYYKGVENIEIIVWFIPIVGLGVQIIMTSYNVLSNSSNNFIKWFFLKD